jgi:L-ascorbate metabolism protein UlaG (beta-lactamase superfamily)
LYIRKGRTDSVHDLFSTPLEEGEAAFIFLGYSGVVLRMAGGTVALDIANLMKSDEISALEELDALLYTHGHGDHYKPREALEVVGMTGAQVVAEQSVAWDLRTKIPSDKLTVAEPGRMIRVGDLEITAIGGVHRGPIVLYKIKIGGSRVFHGGDSGYVPLKEHQADMAFFPTGSPSPTASPKDALKMAMDLKPKVAVAIHGSPSQNREFDRKIREKMPKTTSLIPERYQLEKVALKD